MESHFCRKSTSKEYLHPDLNVKKMFYLYNEEIQQIKCSYHTYVEYFNRWTYPFTIQKKINVAYREGDAAKKLEIQDAFNAHVAEKDDVQKNKKKAKEMSKINTKLAVAVFDLQQVIQLPISKGSALYYCRRLSVFNFIIFNIGSKEC